MIGALYILDRSNTLTDFYVTVLAQSDHLVVLVPTVEDIELQEGDCVIDPVEHLNPLVLLNRLEMHQRVLPHYERKWMYVLRRSDAEFVRVYHPDLQEKELKLDLSDVLSPFAEHGVTLFRLGHEADSPLETVVTPQRGIYASHRHILQMCPTFAALVYDADYFSYEHPAPEDFSKQSNVIWYARNPYNGLEYGHGGAKLFQRRAFLQVSSVQNNEDMTRKVSQAVGTIVIPKVLGEHRFATNNMGGFCTAFREAFKLARVGDAEATQRLHVWCDKSSYAPGFLYLADAASLALRKPDFDINDFDALRSLFLDYAGIEEVKTHAA